MEPTADESKKAAELFNKYAIEYEQRFMDVSIYKHSLNLFCKNIQLQNPTIFDIACGPGNYAKYISNEIPAADLFGIDLAPEMINLARKNNPDSRFETMDCRTIGNLSTKYDAVICAFVTPYLNIEEVSELIKNMADKLNEKGLLYISTMENDYSKSGLEANSKGDLVYLYYYNETVLSAELIKNGLSILDVSRINSVMGNGREVTDIIIVSRK